MPHYRQVVCGLVVGTVVEFDGGWRLASYDTLPV